MSEEENQASSSPKQAFRLENILVKNLSLEVPENVVMPSFSSEPVMKIELRNSSRSLQQDDYHEVILEGTVRVKSGEDLQLLIEVTQAGIFYLQAPPGEARQRFLNIVAPEMLYPYTSQLISDLLIRAGAPRIFLPPFNFKALYEKKLEARQKKLAETETGGKIQS